MDPVVLAPLAVGALAVLAPVSWGWARHAVTLTHEAGHAAVAALTGRRVSAIRLHRDTSGLTESVGRPRGPGMVLTALAGYPAPSLAGLGLLALSDGRVALALTTMLVALAVMLVLIRNWFGALVVAVAGAGVWLLRHDGPLGLQVFALRVLAAVLLAGGLRASLELWAQRRRSDSGASDADLLARLTHVPAAVWSAAFIAVAAGCLWAAWRLLVG